MPIDFQPEGPTLDFQPEQPAAPKEQPTISGDIGHLLETFFGEIGGGLKQALAPEYGKPNRFDTAVGGATGINPETLQKYVSTPVSQLLGAGRVLGAPVTAGLQEPLRMGLERINQMAGGTPETDISGPASVAISMLAPQGLANAIPNLVGKAGRGIARAGVEPFRKASQQNALNTATNLRNADEAAQSLAGTTGNIELVPLEGNKAVNISAKSLFEKQLAEREKQISNVANLERQFAQRQPGGPITTPITEGLRKTPRDVNVFAEFDQLKNNEALALPGLSKTLDDVLARFGEGVAPSLKPTAAVKASEGLQDVAPVVGKDPGAQAFVELNRRLKEFGGDVRQMNIGDFQTNMQGIGRLLHASDSRVAKAANAAYAAGMNDLRAANTPASQALLKGMADYRQNAAADALSKMIGSSTVTKVAEDGSLIFKPEALATILSRDNWKINNIKGSFQKGELESITKTLEDVFRAKKAIPEKPTPPKILKEFEKIEFPPAKAPKPLPEDIIPKEPKTNLTKEMRFGFAGAASSMAHILGLGIPGYGAGFGAGLFLTYVPNLYSRMIFNTAARGKSGQALLRALYVDRPPNLSDHVKAALLMRYLSGSQSEGQ